LTLQNPIFPPLARTANIEGVVEVEVRVRPDGSTEAKAISGHAMLKQAALDSATLSHFECRNCIGPLPYSLIYTFKRVSEDDCCSALSSPVRVVQEPQSFDARGLPQTRISISTGHVCLCDPSSVTTKKVRSLKCFYLWKCSKQE